MSEADQELKQALAENGSFDAGKAEAIKKDLVADFGAKARWVERIAWGYLLACVCACIFAWRAFECSSSTKEQVLFAIVFLVGFETTILIKLWAYAANTKISLLKELKLLRLAQPNCAELPEKYVRPGLSRWERRGWLLAMILAALIVPNVLLGPIGMYKADLTNESYVTLDADGGGTVIAKIEFRNTSTMPITSLDFDAPAGHEIRWLDRAGHEMPTVVSEKDGRKHYQIQLAVPLMPGEWFAYTRTIRSRSLATKRDNGLWKYEFDESYGYRENDVKLVVLLPKQRQGSVEFSGPGSYEHLCLRGRREVFANGRRGSAEPFKLLVEYRMPNEPTSSSATSAGAGPGKSVP